MEISAANPCAVHANVGHDVAAFVGHGDIHGLADFLGFLFTRGDDPARVFQFYGGHVSS
jgi:hypothetical protein